MAPTMAEHPPQAAGPNICCLFFTYISHPKPIEKASLLQQKEYLVQRGTG
jgi:hypothetical protein